MKKLFVSLLMIAAAIFVAPQSAQAVTTTISWFNNSDFTSLLQSNDVSTAGNGCHAMSASANNKTSSIVNSSAYNVWVYDGGSCNTVAGIIYAHSSGAMGAEWNNNISSWARAS